TAQFHTYRMEVVAGGSVTVFYDDVPTLVGHTYLNDIEHISLPSVIWGEVSFAAYGSSDWLYVRHNAHATGCQPPACSGGVPGLVSWWPGDGNAMDLVRTNNGTLQNTAEFNAGFVGQAFDLNGSSDYVEIPDDSTLTPPSMTVTAWVDPATVSADGNGRVILSKYNSNNPSVNGVSWVLLMENTGILEFYVS